MKNVVIFREMPDPITGKIRILIFRVKVRDNAHLKQVLTDINAQYPRRERYDA